MYRIWVITLPFQHINPESEVEKCHSQDGKRVGSSLVIHDWSSFALGAASACEFDAVKRVNENDFCTPQIVNGTMCQNLRTTYPKQGFLIWVTLHIDSAKADNPDFLKFAGMGIDMEIWSMESDYYQDNLEWKSTVHTFLGQTTFFPIYSDLRQRGSSSGPFS